MLIYYFPMEVDSIMNLDSRILSGCYFFTEEGKPSLLWVDDCNTRKRFRNAQPVGCWFGPHQKDQNRRGCPNCRRLGWL